DYRVNHRVFQETARFVKGLKEHANALTKDGIAATFAVEPGGPFGRVRDGQSSDEQVAFAHGCLSQAHVPPTLNAKSLLLSRSRQLCFFPENAGGSGIVQSRLKPGFGVGPPGISGAR